MFVIFFLHKSKYPTANDFSITTKHAINNEIKRLSREHVHCIPYEIVVKIYRTDVRILLSNAISFFEFGGREGREVKIYIEKEYICDVREYMWRG